MPRVRPAEVCPVEFLVFKPTTSSTAVVAPKTDLVVSAGVAKQVEANCLLDSGAIMATEIQ